VQDVLRAVLRRFPPSWVRIVPVRVQGEGAAEEIARAIELLQTGGGQVDVIVLARGGGSLEDLWAFNEERVARAIAASRLPTVSAVGHEVDFSIADFVADARAQTPTQAGDLVVPDLKALHQGLAVIGRRLALASGRYLERGCAGLERLGKMRPFREPQAAVQNLYQRCDEAGAELKFHLYNRVRQWDDALSALSGRLEALSPLRVLARGYSVVLDLEGRVVQNAALLQPGQLLRLRLAQGSAQTRVVDVDPSPNARQGAVMDAGGTSPGSSGSH
jgi:exodeoxyribonuclease VII large subunit